MKAAGLGAQDTICGGGRYDGLIEELGGRPTPGIGFGSQLKSADRTEVSYTVILGEEELKANRATVREMARGQQVEVPFDELMEWLQRNKT